MNAKLQLRKMAERDLGLNVSFVKGEEIRVKGCWHFSTDGNYVNVIFRDENDFRAGMNRIFVTISQFNVLVLAFCLMDNHVHFILYGDFDECNKFMHEYIRRTSIWISTYHNESHSLKNLPIGYRVINDQSYLKTSIAYVVKNPTSAGMPYLYFDYPWSSGALYFRRPGFWTLHNANRGLSEGSININSFGTVKKRKILGTKNDNLEDAETVDNTVFPGEYVDVGIVEKIFKTHKSFNFFLSKYKEEDVEKDGGSISRLSIPDQEMRQHRTELCREMFGLESVRALSADKRLRLAKALKYKYNSSPKQLARICRLKYKELEGLL